MGFFAVRNNGDHLYLDHLYIAPAEQARGIGSMILQWVLRDATEQDLPVRLMALNGSPANGFYRLHGFETVTQDELDTHYQWVPAK